MSMWRGRFLSLNATTKSLVDLNDAKSSIIYSMVTARSAECSCAISCFICSTALNRTEIMMIRHVVTYSCSFVLRSACYDGMGAHHSNGFSCLIPYPSITTCNYGNLVV